MRTLASIQKILDVQPIQGADAIEVCSVLGWKVVAKKGEFKPEDLCVYVEIDSLLPCEPWCSFLWKPKDDIAKPHRLKTVKLRGQVSQGLVLPISVLDGKKFPTDKRDNPVYPRTIGMNVSGMLGITKYDPPIPAQLAGQVKGQFPSFIPKTDETRIQACPEVLDEIKGKDVVATIKMDGSSGTMYWNRNEFGVCSRNLEFKEDAENTFWKMAVKYGVRSKLDQLQRNLAFQGELCGPGIQKNRLGLTDHEWFVFNIYDIDAGKYLGHHTAMELATSIGLKVVPTFYLGRFKEDWTVDILLGLAKGNYHGTEQPQEGIVFRTVEESYSVALKGRMSFKVINNDFLLKGGD